MVSNNCGQTLGLIYLSNSNRESILNHNDFAISQWHTLCHQFDRSTNGAIEFQNSSFGESHQLLDRYLGAAKLGCQYDLDTTETLEFKFRIAVFLGSNSFLGIRANWLSVRLTVVRRPRLRLLTIRLFLRRFRS